MKRLTRRLSFTVPVALFAVIISVAVASAQENAFSVAFYRLTDDGKIITVDTPAEGWQVIRGDARLTDEGLSEIAESVKGKPVGLDLRACRNITDEGLVHLSSLDTLKLLALPSHISNRGMHHISRIYGLVALDITATLVSDSGIDNIKWLNELEYLNLSYTRISDHALSTVNYLRKLETLNISGTGVTDAGLDRIWNLTNLRNISLRYCSRLTGAGLRHLLPLQALERVDISHSPIDDAGMKWLAELPNLTVLNAARTRITDASAGDLRRMKNLKVLNLWDTRITDTGFEDMRWMVGLRRIDLTGTSITDSGLPLLRWMSELETINLMQTPVTDSGKQELMTQIPQVFITK